MGVLFVAEDCVEGSEADGTADEQGRDTKPRLQLRQHGNGKPCRGGEEAGEAGCGLVGVHC